MIPKPDHPVTARFEVSSPVLIIIVLVYMLTSIHFNDQTSLWRTKINYERTNRVLSSKMNVFQAMSP